MLNNRGSTVLSLFVYLFALPALLYYKYKINNLTNFKVSRDGSAKKYPNKDSTENNRQDAPQHCISCNRVSMKKVGMHIVCYFPYYPCLGAFLHFHPYLPCKFVKLFVFLYLLLLLFILILNLLG